MVRGSWPGKYPFSDDPVIYPRDLCEHFVGHWVLELLVQQSMTMDGMACSRNPRISSWGWEACIRDGFRVFHVARRSLAVFEPKRIEGAVKLREVPPCGSGAWVQGQC